MVDAFWDRDAFSVGGTTFLWIDVAFDAMSRGEWAPFERALACGLACAARAESERSMPSTDDVEEAATAFRYERDLISAADVTAWLDRMGLSAEEWTASLTRALLRDRWDPELDDVLDRFAPSARQIVEAAAPEGICSGAFDRFKQTFAGRAAFVFASDAKAYATAVEHPPHDAAPPALEAAVRRLAEMHAHWVSARPAGDVAARLRVVLQLDAALSALVERLTANGQVDAIVEANRLEWMRIELDSVAFASESAAREALLCVREDGLSLYDVAALARRAVCRTTVTLDDLPLDRRERFISAEPGSVLGPLEAPAAFEVAKLISRTPPAMSDPVIASRAREQLVTLALTRAAREHVKSHG